MSTIATGTHWIDAARYALEHKAFVMLEPDGSWHTPTEADDRWLDSYTEEAEIYGTEEPEPTGVILDTFTASMLVGIYDKLSDENRAKFHAMDALRAVDVGWKILERNRA